MQLKVPQRRKLVISLTPLIDVVFILLVFFMLASSFLDWREYEVSTAVPPTDVAERSDSVDPAVVRLQILADGRWLLAGDEIQPQVAEQRLRQLLAERADLRVTVQPAGDTALQQTVAALDAARAAGVKAVSLRPLPGSARSTGAASP